MLIMAGHKNKLAGKCSVYRVHNPYVSLFLQPHAPVTPDVYGKVPRAPVRPCQQTDTQTV